MGRQKENGCEHSPQGGPGSPPMLSCHSCCLWSTLPLNLWVAVGLEGCSQTHSFVLHRHHIPLPAPALQQASAISRSQLLESCLTLMTTTPMSQVPLGSAARERKAPEWDGVRWDTVQKDSGSVVSLGTHTALFGPHWLVLFKTTTILNGLQWGRGKKMLVLTCADNLKMALCQSQV